MVGKERNEGRKGKRAIKRGKRKKREGNERKGRNKKGNKENGTEKTIIGSFRKKFLAMPLQKKIMLLYTEKINIGGNLSLVSLLGLCF